VKARRSGPNSTRRYSEMTDDQLQTRLHGLPPDGREWSAVKEEIDGRAKRRRDDRNFWIFVAGVAIVTTGIAIAVIALR
jgi:hypothetical protein